LKVLAARRPRVFGMKTKRLLEEFAKVFYVKIFRMKAFLQVLLKRLSVDF
jgi:hypothetical protein